MASLRTSPVYGKRIVCNARAGTIAAVAVIALASGFVVAALTQEPESRFSLIWSEGRLM